MSRKIAIVFDDTMDRDDGVQQYIRAVAGGLAGRGHQVEIWCSNSQTKNLAGSNVKIRSLSRNVKVSGNGNHLSIPALPKRSAIRQALAEFKPDVIHVQVPYSPLMSGQVIKLAAKKNIAVVGSFHIHASDGWFVFGNKLLARFQWRGLKRFNQMIAVSPAAQAYCKAVYKIDSQIIPNTHNIKFSNQQTPRKNQRPYILFMGRMEDRKGPQLLLSALPRVLQELPGVDVIFAGGGPMLEKLKAEAAPLKDRVKFTGRFDESKKPGLLSFASLTVYPSYKGESFGIVLIEAFAANGPIVIAGHNAGYDYVMQPMPEQLVDAHDTAALVQKIITLHKLREPAKALIRKKQAKRLQDFAPDAVIPQLEEVYRRHTQP